MSYSGNFATSNYSSLKYPLYNVNTGVQYASATALGNANAGNTFFVTDAALVQSVRVKKNGTFVDGYFPDIFSAYSTFDKRNATNYEIILQKNAICVAAVTYSSKFCNLNIVLDLNGYIACLYDTFYILDSSTLIIKDSRPNNTTSSISLSRNTSSPKNSKGGVIMPATLGTGTAFSLYEYSNLLINGGTIFGFERAISTSNDCTVEVNDGALICGNGSLDTSYCLFSFDCCCTFKMTGGVIENNYSKYSVIPLPYDGSTAELSGGIIRNNKSATGAILAGDYDNNGQTTISGNIQIYDNNAKWGTIQVTEDDIFDITGGKIYNNTSERGGAIYAEYGTINMSGGEIYDNTATLYGGGILLSDNAILNLSGNGKIDHNSAGTGHGGGVLVDSGCRLTMSGGSITRNSSAGVGGVELFGDTAIFEMTGGSITDNVGGNAGGVSFVSDTTFKMSGKPVIKNNKLSNNTTVCNVKLPSDIKIQMTAALTSGADVGVTMASGKGIFTSGAKMTAATVKYFHSDNTANPCVKLNGSEAEITTHSYATSWVWNTETPGNYTAQYKYTCNNSGCGNVEFNDATINKVTTAATCTAAGSNKYTATYGTATNEKTETLNALGHNYGFADWTWNDTNKTATVVLTCSRSTCELKTPAKTATMSHREVVAATCTANGTNEYTAKFTVPVSERSDYDNTEYTATKRYDDIAALGHNFALNANGWSWAANGQSATVSFTCSHDGTHKINNAAATITSAVKTAATCTIKGTTTYTATYTPTKASDYTQASYTDTKDVQDIALKAHTYGNYSWVWNQQTSRNWTAALKYNCTACGGDSHNEPATINKNITEPTCETAGSVAYEASVAVGSSTQKNSKTETLNALGHSYELNANGWNWAADGHSATVSFTCSHDSTHKISNATATITSKEQVAAQCEVIGTTRYTATYTPTNASDYTQASYTDTKDVQDIAALGHNFALNANGWTWAADGKSATAAFTCTRDGSHTVSHNLTTASGITSEETTAATCTVMGTTTYTATFTPTNASEYTQASYTDTKEVQDIAALGHLYGNPVWSWTDDGKSASVIFKCAHNANHTKTEDGTITSEVTTDPTCTVKGTTTYTATYTVPTADGAIFDDTEYSDTKAVQDVDANGHKITSIVITAQPTNKSYFAYETFNGAGMAVYKHCEVCDTDVEAVTDYTILYIKGACLHAGDEFVTVRAVVGTQTLSCRVENLSVSKRSVSLEWEYETASLGWQPIAADSSFLFDGAGKRAKVRAKFAAAANDTGSEISEGYYYLYGVDGSFVIKKGGETVNALKDAGAYSFEIDGTAFTEYAFENNSAAFEIKPVEIELNNEDDFYWTLADFNSALRDGYIDADYKYYSGAADGRTFVKRSIVRNRGQQITVEIHGARSVDTLGEAAGLYDITYIDGCTAETAGAYTATAKLTLKNSDNYKFIKTGEIDADRHMTAVINEDGTVTVTKEWYVATIDNGLKSQNGASYGDDWDITGWTFGEYETQYAPRLEHGDEGVKDGVYPFGQDDNKVTFELYRSNEETGKRELIGEIFNRYAFGEYINEYVPAGSYVLKVIVAEYSVEGAHEHWWNGEQHSESSSGIYFEAFDNEFVFDVEKAELTFVNESGIKDKTFNYVYNKELHLYDEDFVIQTNAKFTTAAERGGAWADEKYNSYYSAAEMEFSLERWSNSDFISRAELSQIKSAKQSPRDADTYVITYRLSAPNYEYAGGTNSFTVVITKQTVSVPEDMTEEYSGSKITYTVDKDAPYEVYGTDGYTYANELGYEIVLKLKNSANYAWEGVQGDEVAVTLTITKARYDMSGVQFVRKEVEYTGLPQSMFISGELPDGVKVTYDGNGKTVVGDYTVTAKFEGDSDNYEDITDMTAPLIIKKATVTVPQDQTYAYNGSVQSFVVAEADKYEVKGVGGYKNVNEVGYTVTLTLVDKVNYRWKDLGENDSDATVKLIITKARYDMSGVTFGNTEAEYDGTEHKVTVSGLPDGVTYDIAAGATIVGTHTLTVTYTGDSVNYEAIPNGSAMLVISKAKVTIPEAQTYKFDGAGHTYEVAADALYETVGEATFTGVKKSGYVVTLQLKDGDNYAWVNASGRVLGGNTAKVLLIINESGVAPDNTVDPNDPATPPIINEPDDEERITQIDSDSGNGSVGDLEPIAPGQEYKLDLVVKESDTLYNVGGENKGYVAELWILEGGEKVGQYDDSKTVSLTLKIPEGMTNFSLYKVIGDRLAPISEENYTVNGNGTVTVRTTLTAEIVFHAEETAVGFPWWAWLLIVVAIVVLIVAVVALVLAIRKSKSVAGVTENTVVIDNTENTDEIKRRLKEHEDQINELLNRDNGGFSDIVRVDENGNIIDK